MQKGKLIILEGGDGVGKTTLLHDLQKDARFNDKSTKYYREPGSTDFGEDARQLLFSKDYSRSLLNTTQALLFAAARSELQKKIAYSLKQGYDVILDRYILSSLVYQGSALNPEKSNHTKFNDERVVNINRQFIQPDFVFLLDIDTDLAISRISNRVGGNYMDSTERDRIEKIKCAYLLYADKLESMMDYDRHVSINVLDAEEDNIRLIQQMKNILDSTK